MRKVWCIGWCITSLALSKTIPSPHGNQQTAPQLCKDISKKNGPVMGQRKQKYGDDVLSTTPLYENIYQTQNSCSTNSISTQKKCYSKKPLDTYKKEGDLIAFVSLSLGDITLKQLHHDVTRVGGRLVLRGLYHNSFRATQKKISDLGITVEIDPPLFERFHVTHVPTFILTQPFPSDNNTTPIHDRLSGNVSLAYALNTFMSEGRSHLLH